MSPLYLLRSSVVSLSVALATILVASCDGSESGANGNDAGSITTSGNWTCSPASCEVNQPSSPYVVQTCSRQIGSSFSCEYRVGGMTFACPSCESCANAASDAVAACVASIPDSDAGTDAGVEDAGFDGGTTHCSGVASSCSSRAVGSCSGGGCYTAGSCTGVAASCSTGTYPTLSQCINAGCSWSGSACTGSTPYTCASSSFSQTYCGYSAGCSYSTVCAGSAWSCDTVTVATCTNQLGCAVVTD